MKQIIIALLAFVLVVTSTKALFAQWTPTSYAQGNINVVYANGNDILVGTNGGNSVTLSTNNGVSWGAANSGILQYADVRAFNSNSNFVFAGATVGVYRALNDGSYSWTKVLDSVTCFSLLTDGSTIYAGTLGRGFFISTDNGTTWTQSNSGMTSYPYVYALAKNNSYIFAGKYGGNGTNADGIYRSSDNGSTWTQVINGLTNTNVFSLATKGNYVFAGTNGGLFRTSDNGDNWTYVAGGVVHTLKVVCNDVYSGLLSHGGINKSSDFGTTWIPFSNGLPNTGGYTVTSLTANDSFMFAGSLGGGVSRAEYTCPEFEQACIEWNMLSSSNITSIAGNITGQPENISGLFVYLPYVTQGQRIWKGINGWALPAGENPNEFLEFNVSSVAGYNLTVNDISFNYSDNPLQTDFNIIKSQVYYSIDNWTTRYLLNSTPLNYLNTTVQLFSVSNLNILVPQGSTFSLRIYPYPPNGGIAMTPSFAIHNNLNICGVTSLASSNSEEALVSEFMLKQNYPNPFNPSTVIDYEIKNSGNVTLSIFNLIGQRVKTLVNEFKSSGSYSTSWNGKNDTGLEVPAGVYFYKIEVGNNVQIKKMLLLK